MMETTYLLLGTNLGDRQHHLLMAKELLNTRAGLIVRASAMYATAAWGNQHQPDFLNQVVELRTEQRADELMHTLLDIEKQLGRERKTKWDARLIDIDILFYGSHIVNQPDLVIPHPRLHQRRFTLVPLAELAPDLEHPVLKKTVRELLAQTTDTLEVKRADLKGS